MPAHDLASLYTVPLSAINGLSRLTTTSNGQARPIQKFSNRPITFESNRNGQFASNLEASQGPGEHVVNECPLMKHPDRLRHFTLLTKIQSYGITSSACTRRLRDFERFLWKCLVIPHVDFLQSKSSAGSAKATDNFIICFMFVILMCLLVSFTPVITVFEMKNLIGKLVKIVTHTLLFLRMFCCLWISPMRGCTVCCVRKSSKNQSLFPVACVLVTFLFCLY